MLEFEMHRNSSNNGPTRNVWSSETRVHTSWLVFIKF